MVTTDENQNIIRSSNPYMTLLFTDVDPKLIFYVAENHTVGIVHSLTVSDSFR